LAYEAPELGRPRFSSAPLHAALRPADAIEWRERWPALRFIRATRREAVKTGAVEGVAVVRHHRVIIAIFQTPVTTIPTKIPTLKILRQAGRSRAALLTRRDK